jgi:hypothetical protein
MAAFKEQSVTTMAFGEAFKKALLNCFQLGFFDFGPRDTVSL